MRILVPAGGGGTSTSPAAGSGSAASSGTGAAAVDHISKKPAPSGAVRATGGAPSDRNTDLPSPSWPVTTRLGVHAIVVCLTFLSALVQQRLVGAQVAGQHAIRVPRGAGVLEPPPGVIGHEPGRPHAQVAVPQVAAGRERLEAPHGVPDPAAAGAVVG